MKHWLSTLIILLAVPLFGEQPIYTVRHFSICVDWEVTYYKSDYAHERSNNCNETLKFHLRKIFHNDFDRIAKSLNSSRFMELPDELDPVSYQRDDYHVLRKGLAATVIPRRGSGCAGRYSAMNRIPLPLTHLIHENLSIILTFAFSRPALAALRERFLGSWKYLDKLIFDISELRAVKVCIELATFIRALDDEQNVGQELKELDDSSFGRVLKADQPDERLYLRDLTNKIIHANSFEWDFTVPDAPTLVCISNGDPKRWYKAEVELVKLASFGGKLMS